MVIRSYADVKVHMKSEDILKDNVIYRLTFPNGKFYIGQTVNTLKSRIYTHCNSSFQIKSNCFNLIKSRAIRKYMQFEVDILYQGDNLDEEEIKFIEMHQSTNPEYGYNMDIGGQGGLIKDNRVKVEQYDLKGNLIQTFESFSEAARKIRPEKIDSCAISYICAASKGRKKTAYGFVWKEIRN